MNLSYRKQDVFETFNVSTTRGYEMLRNKSYSSSSRQFHHNPDDEETRGRKQLISSVKIREMERILEEEGIEARSLTWQQLGYEVGLDCSGRTVQRAMETMDYHKCVSCKKGWVNLKTAAKRVEWSEFMLTRYPNSEDWNRVRFSDEVHFGWGPQSKLRIIRKPGQRYCQDCIQEHVPNEKDKKRRHCWAAVGSSFKSFLHFYDVAGNINGKMSQKAYIDQIFEPVVKPWLDNGQNFVLEEHGDSGHGPGKSNVVRTWKEKNRLEHYFNRASSPDLSPIENCWQPVKQELYKYPH